MIKVITKEVQGANEIIKEHMCDIKILNTNELGNPPYLYLSDDGKHLDAKYDNSLRQIVGLYLGNDTVELYNISFSYGVTEHYSDYKVYKNGLCISE